MARLRKSTGDLTARPAERADKRQLPCSRKRVSERSRASVFPCGSRSDSCTPASDTGCLADGRPGSYPPGFGWSGEARVAPATCPGSPAPVLTAHALDLDIRSGGNSTSFTSLIVRSLCQANMHDPLPLSELERNSAVAVSSDRQLRMPLGSKPLAAPCRKRSCRDHFPY